MPAPDRIRRRPLLLREDFEALVRDEILALVVEDYYPQSLCQTLSQRILSSELVSPYTHEVVEKGTLQEKYFGVDRLGLPFNSTYRWGPDDPRVEEYYSEAFEGIRRLRRLAEPAATPIDKLRLELDEITPEGASIAAFQGRKMLAGIGRITKAAFSHLSAEQPHFDALPMRYARLDRQLAANIYLQVPECGGELEVWDVPPVDPLAKVPADWRSVLPPSQILRPRAGDLILFNCRRPHAIGAFTGPDRVTVQMFIGHIEGRPLQLWN